MKKFIAYCGLDCEKCDARKATLNDDNALREKVAKEWSEIERRGNYARNDKLRGVSRRRH